MASCWRPFIAKPEFTPISITPAQSGPNGSLTAVASLTNPVPYATGYQWTITGGGGAIVFPGGSETMTSSTPSVTIEEPNPTGSSIPFSITASVSISDPTPLKYGPTTATIAAPYISGNTVNRLESAEWLKRSRKRLGSAGRV